MDTREYRTIDKSKWERGPWDHEPDKIQWQDPATGLPCMVKRNPRMGFWCGYVGVPEGHRFFGKHYDEAEKTCDVHGGLTFGDFCDTDGDEARSICHVPAPGEPERVFWLGFDCGHGGDYTPGYPMRFIGDEIYRDLAYVREQCARLAAQLV